MERRDDRLTLTSQGTQEFDAGESRKGLDALNVAPPVPVSALTNQPSESDSQPADVSPPNYED